MQHYDLPLDELRRYRPDLPTPPDLADYWRTTLEGAGPLDARFTPYDSPLRTVDVLDVSFGGFGGQRVAGWLLLPRGRGGPLPCVVTFVGYGGGRGLPHEWLDWTALGYAHVVMDTRGQGSTHHAGSTPDLDPSGAGPHAPGFLTLGLPHP
ncbi:MAG: acetylxylan esterase, partial [Actinomycetes bacterium]